MILVLSYRTLVIYNNPTKNNQYLFQPLHRNGLNGLKLQITVCHLLFGNWLQKNTMQHYPIVFNTFHITIHNADDTILHP